MLKFRVMLTAQKSPVLAYTVTWQGHLRQFSVVGSAVVALSALLSLLLHEAQSMGTLLRLFPTYHVESEPACSHRTGVVCKCAIQVPLLFATGSCAGHAGVSDVHVGADGCSATASTVTALL